MARHMGPIGYLESRALFGVKLGLQTTRALAKALGQPQRDYPSILVGGTNGKGSVVAYVDAALRASGLRVGRYTSPHLVRVHERFVVDGKEIAPHQLARAIERVRDAAETLRADGRIPAHPTYFEVTTAVALDHFRRQRVDVAILEVGMGGRLDATRICEPRVSTIVSIDRDHEAFLGTTLAAIAREKAGVLRRGCVTVIGPMVGEARTAIAARARRAGARLVVAERGASVHATARATTIRTSQHVYRIGTPLAPHQRHNALVAVRVLEEARRSGIPVDLGAVAPAFERAEWPGRLQWLPDRPPLLLDGAHNPAAAHALAEHLTTRGPFVLLFGMMADKDIEAVTRTLFPLARAVVVTRARDARAATPAEIVRRAGNAAAGIVRQSNPRHALAKARALAQPGEVVVVAGSLYLVGEVLRLLR